MENSNDPALWQDAEAYKVLEQLCAKHQVPVDILKDLVAVERQHQHRDRARGIYDEFDHVFEKMD